MSPKTKTKDTTTTSTTPNLDNVLGGINNLNAGGALAGVGAAAGLGSSTATIGVPTTQAGDTFTFSDQAHKGQLGLPASVDKLLTTDAAGNETITYAGAVQLLRLVQGNRKLISEIQSDLVSAGYIPASTKVSYGTLDSTTANGWKRLITDVIGTKIPMTTLLSQGAQAPLLVHYVNSLQGNLANMERNATQVTNSNVNLTDPNEVAQRYAGAMESLGLGAPSQAQTAKFVDAFIHGPQGEVAASVNEVRTQKGNDASSVAGIQQALTLATQGNLSGAQRANLSSTVGPVNVATKAAPNLDAEAMAAAKASNPGAYYAQGASEAYGILQEMMGGSIQMPTSATPPSAQGLGGAIVTAPLQGVM